MAHDQRRYRKIFVRVWSNRAFQALTREQQVVTLYLLTGPQTNRIGIYRLSLGSAGEDLGMSADAVLEHITAICRAFGWQFDSLNRVFWIPSWWSYNQPTENDKNFRGALSDLSEVPDSRLIVLFLQSRQYVPACLHPIMDTVSARYKTLFDRCSIGDGNTVRTNRTEQQEQENTPQAGGDDDVNAPSPVERFWDRWRALHAETHHGATLPLTATHLETGHVIALLEQYPIAHLEKMAEVFMRRTDADVRGKPKSMGLFRHHAPWCDAMLREHGFAPAGSAA
jgi:hypothetical protein